MDLVQWLRDQLDEDERIAREASGATVVGEPGNWQPAPGGDEWEASAGDIEEELLVALRPGLPRPPDVMSGMWGAWASNEPDPAGAGSAMPALIHTARHDPARVLREIEFKRALIDAVVSARHDHDYWHARPPADRERRIDVLAKMTARWSAWQFVATQLAAPYADRPGYAEALAAFK